MIFDNGKKAENIATIVPEKDNPYEENIHNAAITLLKYGYSDVSYLTQYSSGNSTWRLPDNRCLRYIKEIGFFEFV